METRPQSGLPLAGGIFAILAGLAALGQGILYLMAESAVSTLLGDVTGILCFCGGLDVLFGLGSLIAGIFALQRKHFVLSLLGAILGLLGLGFVIGSVFGLIAIILIAVSRAEYED